jgi:DNA polymerase I-like protein with 3'-5' exonuclease and polymerase domains
MYQLSGVDVFNLTSVKVTKLLVRDVDLNIQDEKTYDAMVETSGELGFCPAKYDWVILVGSEALKMFTKATAVTDYSGKVAPGKKGETNFIASISPAALAFKPETKPVFDATVLSIASLVSGTGVRVFEGDYKFFLETQPFKEYLEFLIKSDIKVIGLDSETSALSCRDGYVLGVSMSHKVGQGVYAHADCIDMECIDLMQELLDTRTTVLHNAKFDMHFLGYHFGLKFLNRDIQDTMIMHYLLDERQGTHGLKSLTMKYGVLGDYDRELDEYRRAYCGEHKIPLGEFTYDLFPWDIIKIYAAKDTDATLALYFKFQPVLASNPKLLECYNTLMLPGMHFLTKMEDRGVPISKDRLVLAKKLLTEELDTLQKEMYSYKEIHELEAMQGDVFLPGSVNQLRILLFDLLNLPPTGKLTKTKAISTDAEVLKELGEKHRLPGLILEIRQKTKLKNTYIDKLIPAMDRDSKVRTGFNITSTTSGRLSSSGKFNMQQLPRDNPIIKGCVKAPEGYKIVAVDLSTAEVYYAAVLSNDANMKQIFLDMKRDPKKYPDFHASVAHMVFNLTCSPAEVKKLYPALRQAAKAITFGILYGSGPAKVAESVNLAFAEEGQAQTCTLEDAKGYIFDYFTKFSKLKRWIDNTHREIKSKGYVYNFFGRKRRLHNVNSIDKGVAAGEVRSGFNAVIQSVSSDHLLLGAIDADELIEATGMDAGIFALVHDSVVAVVKTEQVPDYINLITSCIQINRGCSIPGCPIGVEEDSEPGGSQDYSCGKLAKMFPELAAI